MNDRCVEIATAAMALLVATGEDQRRCVINVSRYPHFEPCGPQRDPGPRDDTGERWHWCYDARVNDMTFQGRADDVLAVLAAELERYAEPGASA